jgi:hypothetical protein
MGIFGCMVPNVRTPLTGVCKQHIRSMPWHACVGVIIIEHTFCLPGTAAATVMLLLLLPCL